MPKGTRSANSKELAPDATQPEAPETGGEPPPSTAAAGPVTVHVSQGGQVTISVQPSAAAAAPEVGLEAFTEKAFGLPGFLRGDEPEEVAQPSALDQVRDSLRTALETLGQKFVQFATDITTLEVRTFVSERIEDVRPDGANGFEFAQQRAMTYINFDGDTEVVVPVDAGEIDEALWKIHLQTVEAAQAHRTAMLKTIGELVQGFIPTLK